MTGRHRSSIGSRQGSGLGEATSPSAGIRYVREGGKTAVYFDARSPEEFKAGSFGGARHLPRSEVSKAKDDGRLPMDDHDTRIVVFGTAAAQAREVAEEITTDAFHNVSFYSGPLTDLKRAEK